MKHLFEKAMNLFDLRSFKYKEENFLEKRLYTVKSVQVNACKLLIKTDLRTFVFQSESNYEQFVSSVEFVEEKKSKGVDNNAIRAEIMSGSPKILNTITNSMLVMFEKAASGNVDADALKSMKVASDLAGKIIEAEKLKFAHKVKSGLV